MTVCTRAENFTYIYIKKCRRRDNCARTIASGASATLTSARRALRGISKLYSPPLAGGGMARFGAGRYRR